MRDWRVAALAGTLVTCAVPSVCFAGQGQGSSPAITIGAGAGTGKSSLHDEAGGLTWDVALRVRMRRFFGIEIGLGQLRTEVSRAVLDQTIRIGEVTGHIDRIDMITERSTTWVGVNALAMVPVGRATVYGGGGLGTSVFNRVFTQRGTGCDPGVATLCNPVVIPHTSTGFRVQGVAGVDVDLGARLVVFGQARFGVQDGYTDTLVLAGLRVVIR